MSTKQLTAYTVRSYQQNGEEKSFWTRIGRAFENKDGSLNIYLEALPTSGKIQVRAKEIEENDTPVLSEMAEKL